MNFERPSGEQREKETPSIDKVLERAIMLRSMKNWLGPFMARHAAEDAEQPLGYESRREDFVAAITRDQEAAEDRGDIEGAAKLEEMRKHFENKTLVPPEVQTMKEIVLALGEEYERAAKLAREARE
ncbi:MAG: hypothetical protein HYV25_01550 [Candidatus Harrisonbacteria bacterium]|nr:hypothetical protein [Candidatus Harrisonbacteria bacterium]